MTVAFHASILDTAFCLEKQKTDGASSVFQFVIVSIAASVTEP